MSKPKPVLIIQANSTPEVLGHMSSVIQAKLRDWHVIVLGTNTEDLKIECFTADNAANIDLAKLKEKVNQGLIESANMMKMENKMMEKDQSKNVIKAPDDEAEKKEAKVISKPDGKQEPAKVIPMSKPE